MDERILLFGQNFWNIEQIKKNLSKTMFNKTKKSKSYETKKQISQPQQQNRSASKSHSQNRKQYKQYIKQGHSPHQSAHRFLSKSKGSSHLQKKARPKQRIQDNTQSQISLLNNKAMRFNSIYKFASPNDHIPYNVVCRNVQKFQQKSTQLKHFAQKKMQKMKSKKQNQLDKYECQSQQELVRHKDDQKLFNRFKKKITKHDQEKFQQKVKATLLISNDMFKKKKCLAQESQIKKKRIKQNGFRLKGVQLLKSLIVKNRKEIGVSKIQLFSNNFFNSGSKLFSQHDGYKIVNQLSNQSFPRKQYSNSNPSSDLRKSFALQKTEMQSNEKKKLIQNSSQLIEQTLGDIHWKAQKNLSFLINNYYSQINFKTMKKNKKISTVQNFQGHTNIALNKDGRSDSFSKIISRNSGNLIDQYEQDNRYRLVLMNRYQQNPKLFLSSLKKR